MPALLPSGSQNKKVNSPIFFLFSQKLVNSGEAWKTNFWCQFPCCKRKLLDKMLTPQEGRSFAQMICYVISYK